MRRLRAAIGPDRWLLVEKILGVGEELPASWPVDGTSGYEALREIQGVFVDPDGAGLLTQLAAEHTGRKESLHAAEHAARREVADTILAAEVRRIAALVPVPSCAAALATAAGASETEQPPAADGSGEAAVAELLCGFPVYRSYLPEGRDALDTAVSVARTHRPDLADVLDAIRAAMLADPAGLLATRVQQTSGHGDGQGRGGHRFLPVEPVRRAQRGGRRPVPLRRAPARSSTRAWPRGRRHGLPR